MVEFVDFVVVLAVDEFVDVGSFAAFVVAVVVVDLFEVVFD